METSSIKTPFPGRVSVPRSFVSLFIFYILSCLPSKTIGCLSGRLMSAASDQKVFCELCSAFSCSSDEFAGEKVVSPSCSSAILAPPPSFIVFFFFFLSMCMFGFGASSCKATKSFPLCCSHDERSGFMVFLVILTRWMMQRHASYAFSVLKITLWQGTASNRRKLLCTSSFLRSWSLYNL